MIKPQGKKLKEKITEKNYKKKTNQKAISTYLLIII